MIVSKDEVLNFFESIYDKETEIAAIRDDIKENIDIYADDNKISKKTIRQGYAVYKSYRNGKVQPDDDAYYEIIAAVEEKFAAEV
jgi:hypothetical protein